MQIVSTSVLSITVERIVGDERAWSDEGQRGHPHVLIEFANRRNIDVGDQVTVDVGQILVARAHCHRKGLLARDAVNIDVKVARTVRFIHDEIVVYAWS